MKLVKIGLLLPVALTVLWTGCDQKKDETSNQPKQATLVYIQWDEGIAYTHLAANVLETHLGYEVTLISADLDAAYKAVAETDADAFMESWQPVLHRSFLEKYRDHLMDLGSVIDSTQSGLVVPAYMPVDSIRQLRTDSIKSRLNGTITGIEEGAGIMQTTRKVMSRYELDYRLVSSSGPAMTAALKRAVMNREWIVVTGWKPHWIFGEWDLKFLKQDPDKKLWREGAIHIVGRKDLMNDKPELARFLSNMNLSEPQLYDLMISIKKRGEEDDIKNITGRWMREHPELIKKWLPDQ